MTCGALTVPEDHDQPDGPTIELPYIILHSTADDPIPDPVVFTAGGPGDSSLDSVWRRSVTHRASIRSGHGEST